MIGVSPGDRALVIGAGRGLGAAIADHLHAQGVGVIGTSRDVDEAQRLATRYGGAPVVLDVQQVEQVRATIGGLADDGVLPAMLVCNAGVNRPRPALEVEEADWDLVQGTNLRGLFFVAQAVARRWIADGVRGAVVAIGSQAGRVAIEDRSNYGASKAGVEQLVRSLAFEWARHGIRVNTVAPTFVLTAMTAQTLGDPERSAELLSRTPLGRFGVPEDVVGAVEYLLSPSAAMVTGHTLMVDGGYTIH